MSAASELREYTDRSNSIHKEYLGNPELLRRYEHFVDWQLNYMLPFYEDLGATEDRAEAVKFFVSDLTGIDISERDHEFAKVVPLMSRMLPDKALDAVATAMRLNARVLGVNLSICRELYKEISIDTEITEASYCSACRRASQLEECLELVHLTAEIGRDLDQLIRIPMIGLTLRAMRLPARLAGFGALQNFLETGYRTFNALEDVHQFLDDMTVRMTEVFTQIFTKPIQ
ncbi:MAG: hypothetical protein DRR11_09465 [Gammaproteobacteria bacterium]|nr:MAG: hypothetical protein DRR11_09465 [Gammaproteobacteria bacterium]RLA32188.1 MAG: hypothetical protein DRR15_12120 [Gammaproteobacteria bacterium]